MSTYDYLVTSYGLVDQLLLVNKYVLPDFNAELKQVLNNNSTGLVIDFIQGTFIILTLVIFLLL